MDYDDFKLREMKAADGVRRFKAPNGSIFHASASALDAAPHVIRVSIKRVGKTGRVLTDLGYQDVHFAPQQDLEVLVMKNIKMRIFSAADTEETGKAAAAYLGAKWGGEAPPP